MLLLTRKVSLKDFWRVALPYVENQRGGSTQSSPLPYFAFHPAHRAPHITVTTARPTDCQPQKQQSCAKSFTFPRCDTKPYRLVLALALLLLRSHNPTLRVRVAPTRFRPVTRRRVLKPWALGVPRLAGSLCASLVSVCAPDGLQHLTPQHTVDNSLI
jgi:hypothetical protein